MRVAVIDAMRSQLTKCDEVAFLTDEVKDVACLLNGMVGLGLMMIYGADT